MPRPRLLPVTLAGPVIAVLLGCTIGANPAAESAAPADTASGTPSSGSPADTQSATPSAKPTPTSTPTPTTSPERTSTRGQTAWLTIPAIGLDELRIVPYEGTTDDAPGTRIQNGGVGASPQGSRGGVGPGEVGNYLVTAHRLSAGGPLRDLPSLDEGEVVRVRSGGTVYEYEITATRQTSFRSERSLAEQRAAVPGSPGERPTEAVITISTCATPEDNAAGNFWRDAQGNPEHRVDKIGVLRSPQ